MREIYNGEVIFYTHASVQPVPGRPGGVDMK